MDYIKSNLLETSFYTKGQVKLEIYESKHIDYIFTFYASGYGARKFKFGKIFHQSELC